MFCADVDGAVAQVAAASCRLNFPPRKRGPKKEKKKVTGRREKTSECKAESLSLDWEELETWPRGAFDVALAADVLYRASFASAVAGVLGRTLKVSHGLGIVADPAHRPYRSIFAERCAEHGLLAVVEECPDSAEVVFVKVSRVDERGRPAFSRLCVDPRSESRSSSGSSYRRGGGRGFGR